MPNYASIKNLLDASGSDKGKWYGGLYDVLLQPHRLTIRRVVEIGIGTMIPFAPSSMVGWAGENYQPGASLRVWRDFFPNAIVHGLDIAPDTQFSEDRIQTHLCNSTNLESVRQILPHIGTPDLIIDDGLHTLEAQKQTLTNLFPVLCSGGLFVVEDVSPADTAPLIEKLQTVCPGCPAFVDRSHQDWVAVVIRKPESNG